MSETQTEPDTPLEEPPLGDPVETPGQPQEEPEPQPDPEPDTPEAPPSESPEEIDAIYTRLETRAKNYVKSVGEIIEGTGVPVELCELCADCYPGMRWREPHDDAHAAMIAVSGADEAASPLPLDKDAQVCDRCEGWGATQLPTHVPDKKFRTCLKCNGVGYLDPNPQSGALQAPKAATENGAVELPAGVPEYDPRVASLRAEGYMVMPLPNLGGIAEHEGANG